MRLKRIAKRLFNPTNVRQAAGAFVGAGAVFYSGMIFLNFLLSHEEFRDKTIIVASIFMYGMIALLAYSAVRLWWAWIRQSDKKKKIITLEAGSGAPKKYAELDYSGLVPTRPGVFRSASAWMWLDIAFVVIIAAVSFQSLTRMDVITPEARLGQGVLVVFVALIVITLIIFNHTRKHRGQKKLRDPGYEVFANDNNFRYVQPGSSDILKNAVDNAKDTNSVHHQISGEYRGYVFVLGQVFGSNDRQISHGVLAIQMRSPIIHDDSVFDEIAILSPIVNKVTYDTQNVYLITNDSMPADRAEMIYLFRDFDTIVDRAKK